MMIGTTNDNRNNLRDTEAKTSWDKEKKNETNDEVHFSEKKNLL